MKIRIVFQAHGEIPEHLLPQQVHSRRLRQAVRREFQPANLDIPSVDSRSDVPRAATRVGQQPVRPDGRPDRRWHRRASHPPRRRLESRRPDPGGHVRVGVDRLLVANREEAPQRGVEKGAGYLQLRQFGAEAAEMGGFYQPE